MNCAEASQLLEAYHDGELDLVRSVEVEQHVAACANCARRLQNLRTLRSVIAPAAFSAPEDLRDEIFSIVPKIALMPMKQFPRVLTNVLALAAALAIGFFLARFFAPHVSEQQTLVAALTDSHIRSLAGTHLVDVPSSDQHTVRPWFEGKIDFAPPVEDLSSAGFPLVGGRLEYISGRAVAALVYERRKHFINVFIWPANKSEALTPSAESQRGYNILHWQENGMSFWAVSEINSEDLEKFAAALRATLKHG